MINKMKLAAIPTSVGLIIGGSLLAAAPAMASTPSDVHVDSTKTTTSETTHTNSDTDTLNGTDTDVSNFLNGLFGEGAVKGGLVNINAPLVDAGEGVLNGSPVASGNDTPVASGNEVTAPIEAPVEAPVASGNEVTAPVEAPVVSGNTTEAPVASGNETNTDVTAPVEAPVTAPVEAGNGNEATSHTGDINTEVNDLVDSTLDGVDDVTSGLGIDGLLGR